MGSRFVGRVQSIIAWADYPRQTCINVPPRGTKDIAPVGKPTTATGNITFRKVLVRAVCPGLYSVKLGSIPSRGWRKLPSIHFPDSHFVPTTFNAHPTTKVPKVTSGLSSEEAAAKSERAGHTLPGRVKMYGPQVSVIIKCHGFESRPTSPLKLSR